MLLHSNYNKIKDTAFANGWIVVDGMQLKDVSQAGQTTFEEKNAFAVAPLVNSLNDFSATFMLSSQFIFSKTVYDKLLIDFNDWNGLQPLLPDQSISASFSFGNSATITVMGIAGNDTLISRSQIQLITQSTFKTAGAVEAPAYSCSLVVNGKTHWYGVWPGCESIFNPCGGCLKKVKNLTNKQT